MAIHLRQICLVAREIAPAQRALERVLSIRPCHVDPAVGQWGLENVLLPVGSQFVEVVAPVREDTAAGRYLERRGGDGGYMVICQVPTREEQDAARRRAADAGVRVAYESDRGSCRLMQLHPRDLSAAFLEIDWDEHADPAGNWEPAGGTGWRDAVSTEAVDGITAVELQGPEPAALADLWSRVIGSPIEDMAGTPAVRLANAVLRFVPDRDGRGPGLGGIEVRSADPDRLNRQADAEGARDAEGMIAICGTRFEITTR